MYVVHDMYRLNLIQCALEILRPVVVFETIYRLPMLWKQFSLVPENWGLMHVGNVVSRINLRSPHKPIRYNTFLK